MTSTTEFAVTVEACEPDELREEPRVASGVISFTETGGGCNCPEIEIYCFDEAILLDFIYDGWVGDNEHGDLDWFRWVATQIRLVGVDATERNALRDRIARLADADVRRVLLADLYEARSDSQLEEMSEAVAECEAQESDGPAPADLENGPSSDEVPAEAMFTVGGVAVESGRDLVGADLAPLMVPRVEPDREILVHLNVSVPASDERSVEEIVALIDGAIEVGLSGETDDPLTYTIPMAEEV